MKSRKAAWSSLTNLERRYQQQNNSCLFQKKKETTTDDVFDIHSYIHTQADNTQRYFASTTQALTSKPTPLPLSTSGTASAF